MLADWPLLSLLIWLPIIGGGLVTMSGEAGARRLALVFALITFGLTLPLYAGFDTTTAQMQFQESWPWLPSFNIHYALGIDGIALPLIMLTAFVTVLVVLAGWRSIEQRVAQYMGAFLILEGIMIGVFCARDAILFYIFFEAQLIPMFLIIGIWGGPNRVYATIKFFLYTFLGSVLMLVSLLYLYYQAGTFAFDELYRVPLSMQEQVWIFLAMLIAFAVKIPMWPVHTWLPDAHVEAPTGGSVILAAIMLKMGGYGFLRLSLPIAPDASAVLAELVIALSLIAIVYIGFVALAQSDLKKLIAYSSISHMGFVTLGTFVVFLLVARSPEAAGAQLGIEGAMVQMVSHGLVSAALFLCVGVLYDRMHTRMIADYGGVVNVMPVFASFMVLFAMSNAGLPGTSGFVGEFMVILATFHADLWLAALAALTLILGAAYTLWMIKRVIFGAVANEAVAGLSDVDRIEFVVLGLLALSVLALGVWPAPLLEVMHPAVDHLLGQVAGSKL